jgi:hypothetical protein
VELPVDAPVSGVSAPQPDIGWAGAVALVFVLPYTLILAAGGGYVFYASTHPVSIPMGYGAPFISLPWSAAAFLIIGAWVVCPVALLIAGLIHLLLAARRKWWPAIAWVGALAAGTAIGYVIWHDYLLLFTAYPADLDGTPLGPSRWAPGGPFWQALVATIGQCVVGVVLIALITVSARRAPSERATSWLPDLPWTMPGDPAE